METKTNKPMTPDKPKTAEEIARNIANIAWRNAANQFRLYPDNKHTFAESWDHIKSSIDDELNQLSNLQRELDEAKKQLDDATKFYYDMKDESLKLYDQTLTLKGELDEAKGKEEKLLRFVLDWFQMDDKGFTYQNSPLSLKQVLDAYHKKLNPPHP